MLPNQTEYVMGRKGSRKFSPCGRCAHPVRPGRKYVIDPADTSVVYHADCYRQAYRQHCKRGA